MSRVYDYYRTPDQSEVEEQERLEYLRWYQEQERLEYLSWYQEQQEKQNQEKSKEDGKEPLQD